jgi:surfactin synthase thioesterase subunit
MEVFKNINAIWGTRWCTHLNDPELAVTAQSVWIEALKDLEEEQVNAAIKKLSVTCEYAPTIAQFRKAALNIISSDAAYAEACRWRQNKELKCSNVAVFKAADAIISWDWCNLSPRDLKDAYKAQYVKFSEMLLMGGL